MVIFNSYVKLPEGTFADEFDGWFFGFWFVGCSWFVGSLVYWFFGLRVGSWLVGSLAGSLADSSVLCLAIVWMIGWIDR